MTWMIRARSLSTGTTAQPASSEMGWWQPYTDKPNAGTQLYGAAGFGELFPTRLVLPDLVNGTETVVDAGFDYPRTEEVGNAKYGVQLAYFLDCIRENRAPVPGGIEGLINMKVVDAAYESSRTGQVVFIEL